MKQLSITLTDEQYLWAKQWGRLWLRDVIQSLMDSGYAGDVPDLIPKPKKKRWWSR